MTELFEDNYQITHRYNGAKIMGYYGSLENCHKWLKKMRTSPELVKACSIEEYNYNEWHGSGIIRCGQTHGEIEL